ncbi:hypothetical protein SETIT_5G174700v2 [Setaria italica]|uniref:Uncharacterized protein n=1 Tax=Setaria italica TaxID=4555 RepID=A0A368R5Q5_SETIT|nr:hypothetical protein SETIT_5G174700v2 [Setaria italica]RCV25537.1 hypothetical protein SETIT_5G174700v2 [Setaria italica]RCV25538.1 hypothetical protein SETIT_5G174700v2 [Setaria italica]
MGPCFWTNGTIAIAGVAGSSKYNASITNETPFVPRHRACFVFLRNHSCPAITRFVFLRNHSCSVANPSFHSSPLQAPNPAPPSPSSCAPPSRVFSSSISPPYALPPRPSSISPPPLRRRCRPRHLAASFPIPILAALRLLRPAIYSRAVCRRRRGRPKAEAGHRHQDRLPQEPDPLHRALPPQDDVRIAQEKKLEELKRQQELQNQVALQRIVQQELQIEEL